MNLSSQHQKTTTWKKKTKKKRGMVNDENLKGTASD